MVDIDVWMGRIGLFNFSTRRLNSSDDMLLRMLLGVVLALLYFLLVVSGDVKLNPGPRLGEYVH